MLNKLEIVAGSGAPPPVSIGLPVYNGERYLADALDSIVTQTFGDFELIISDNASTDQTEDICRDYATRDSRIRYVRNPINLGASLNYKQVFDLSSGRYFRWTNHDDILAPNLLARCFEVIEQDLSVVLAYCRTRLISADGSPISDYEDRLHVPEDSPSERFIQVLSRIGMCNVIYGLMRSEPMKNTALIANYIGSDIAFVAELALYGKLCEIPERLFSRRIHPHAYSSQKDIRKLLEFNDPTTRSHVPLKTWRRIREHFKAVERAPLGMREKMRLRRYLLRNCIWERSRLSSEVTLHVLNRLAR
jgi:glycosyltransferase involved in cell wall biosynthesis